MRVDLEKLLEIKAYFKTIEDQDINEIEWYKDGEKLEVDSDQLEEFRFMGLNNRNFPEIVGWIDGIKVTTLEFSLK